MGNRASIQRDKGEGFRSVGETQIARLLDHVGITYLYEHPIAVLDEGKVRIWYPDFQLPKYGILIEYFGVTGNPDYEDGIRKKLATYESNGLTAFGLRPDDLTGDWPVRFLCKIEETLEDRLGEFHVGALCFAQGDNGRESG